MKNKNKFRNPLATKAKGRSSGGPIRSKKSKSNTRKNKKWKDELY